MLLTTPEPLASTLVAAAPPGAPRRPVSSPRHVQKMLAASLLEVGVQLDPERTKVHRNGDRVDVVVTVLPPAGETAPDSFERDMLCSAAHMVVVEDLTKFGVPAEMLSVQVHMLPPLGSSAVPSSAPPAANPTESPPVALRRPSQWILAQSQGLHNFSMHATSIMVSSSYRYVVDTLPWRHRATMAAAIPMLTQRFLQELAAGTRTPWNTIFVDDVLPSMDALLTTFDQGAVREEVTLHLGRPPATLLELYEVVLGKAWRGRCHKWQTLQLSIAVFDLSHVKRTP